MTNDERLAEIEAELASLGIGPTDEEVDHSRADALLLDALRIIGATKIADAWEAARERAGFWYA